ncbi:YbhB/YbcL family Raf kinase inhibitor-like protein [Bdellovibrio bacteriovorus]|uniref:Phosphatidylethanolamine-binding protein n=1 Tax=Bdellovibrio bacteriovorus TaxID=959 RepID=A0A150WU90_BDEBC|nr:YbhB/YbcL family Raf kinase inhibitor-like protein [Bdellovibrio bacteriovorus]KYG70003.1 hypothetical protein AZI85_15020 [Bdellovibrio bacteriovorus]
MQTHFTISSPVFENNGEIPKQYTCEGDDMSPPLEWYGAPQGTKSYAIIVDDPDAPDPSAPKRTWVHWVVYNIPAEIHALPENFHDFPEETQEVENDWKASGYRGPCPPIGKHHYHHKIYALNTFLPQNGILTKEDLLKAMKGHILGEADLVGTYEMRH